MQLRSGDWTHRHTVTQVKKNVSRAAECSHVQMLRHMDTRSHRLNIICQKQQDAVTLSCLDTWSHGLNIMCQEQGDTVTFKCLDTWTHGNTG
jgi:hypothetical protein